MQNYEIKKENSVADVIKARRSIKRFTNEPVSESLLVELLNTAIWAPNHKLREPWRFIAFKDNGRERLLNAALSTVSSDKKEQSREKFQKKIMNAPLHLVIVMHVDPRQKQYDEDFAATSACVQNLMLAAWEKGLGTIWKTPAYINEPVFREQIGVADGEKIIGIIQMGTPEMIPSPQQRTKAEEKLTIISE
ncbi:nitroreductase family protein [Fictibacillus gelatini]|uniref:nitroreductase family protein n=1 Tax=Fictibacillus gelatini TaxID=225985 RepID=UPI00040E809D|nr:nitroreductase [Fictibacillus gelatini]